jgi:hypothetical protein
VQEVLDKSKESGWLPVEDEAVLNDQSFKIAYPLRREDKVQGLLTVVAASASLTPVCAFDPRLTGRSSRHRDR